MSEPPSTYTETVQMLKSFRQKIISDLVSARINARLDASHLTMQKYSRLLDRLSIVPYIFGRIREHALALRINGNDIGFGEMRKITAQYTGTNVDYPLSKEPVIPYRKLPQVDVFRYDPPTIANVAEIASEELWANYFTLQCDKGKHKETPDVQNVFFDYYKFRPIGRAYLEISLSNQETGFENYATLKGEATILARSVTPTTEVTMNDYIIYVFVDADFFSSTAKITSVPMVLVVTSDTALKPVWIILAGGKRVPTNIVGVYASNITDGQLVGWTKIASNYTETVKNILWANSSILTIEVNDPMLGTTDPLPDKHNYKAIEEAIVTAIPNTGYQVVGWELDGVQFPASPTFTVRMYRDHKLICMFGTSDTAYLRPIGDVESLNIRRYPPDTELYTQISEEISDGDATYLHDWITGRHDPIYYCKALFSVPAGLVPAGKIIDYVEVFVRPKSPNAYYPAKIALWIRTYGEDYVSDYDWVYEPYELKSYKWTTNPSTGDAWKVDEINSLRIGFQGMIEQHNILETGDYLRVTQLWAEVAYHS